MRIRAILLVMAICLGTACGGNQVEEGKTNGVGWDESRFLSGVHQLTTEGKRAGEGYFSPDGSKLVYQSERIEGNPFFQIYEHEFSSGESRLISTGVGKTTCAFYQRGTENIQFASTHHDPRSAEIQQTEVEFLAGGGKHHYAWDYDPEMELYVYERQSGELRRLTNAYGYDAEGSYSPDGEWIVFTSIRDAYDRDLSAEEAAQLERDPSFFGEIYLIRADGSGVRRLTDVPGYDGGPFFTADGEQIVWRRFDTTGRLSDIWLMRADGSEQRQITDFGSMSWAPYPHPSGEYFIFLSNKLGFKNFELFIVDAEGSKEPVRVTYTPGMDGLPVFSPDGAVLAWTSTRGEGSRGQLWMAEWNHQAALDALQMAPPRVEQPEDGSAAAGPEHP